MEVEKMIISAKVIRRSTKIHRCDAPEPSMCGRCRDIYPSEAHLRLFGAAHSSDSPYTIRLHIRCRDRDESKVETAIIEWKETVRRECRERQAGKAV